MTKYDDPEKYYEFLEMMTKGIKCSNSNKDCITCSIEKKFRKIFGIGNWYYTGMHHCNVNLLSISFFHIYYNEKDEKIVEDQYLNNWPKLNKNTGFPEDGFFRMASYFEWLELQKQNAKWAKKKITLNWYERISQ